MAISCENSQQTTLNVVEQGADGEAVTAASVTCYIRPGQTLNISLEVRNAEITSENIGSVAAAIGEYLGSELAKAAATGIPAPTVLNAGE